ncbi:hypothetical protein DICVIV_02973 [Dictyocaulus viviparus]|uniref:Uncharacterized protein n=1 Tax=Dictyocaulus viviparus TaxID=29172 RepID=A0A0D8Y1V6_DICVI|nr:hypothetical protein DICVIV_02973 [Dictyocaulus viviparus]
MKINVFEALMISSIAKHVAIKTKTLLSLTQLVKQLCVLLPPIFLYRPDTTNQPSFSEYLQDADKPRTFWFFSFDH